MAALATRFRAKAVLPIPGLAAIRIRSLLWRQMDVLTIDSKKCPRYPGH